MVKIKSFVISISSDGNGETARTIPVSIKPTVYGTFRRRTAIDTSVAISSSVEIYSRLRFNFN